MFRNNSSDSYRRKLKTPEHFELVEKRRKNYMQKNELKMQRMTATPKKTPDTQLYTSKVFRETGTTFRGRGFSHQIRSTGKLPANMREEQEKSSLHGWQRSDKNQIPLSVFRQISTENKKTFENQKPHSVSSLSSKKYLRKGTAVNRAIMLNILKKKHNKLVSDIPQSYSTNPVNYEMTKRIKLQIPKGLRDVVGAQQMLRMSHIFTGANIKSTNLHMQVNRLISKYAEQRVVEMEEDELTLKSIKRW